MSRSTFGPRGRPFPRTAPARARARLGARAASRWRARASARASSSSFAWSSARAAPRLRRRRGGCGRGDAPAREPTRRVSSEPCGCRRPGAAVVGSAVRVRRRRVRARRRGRAHPRARRHRDPSSARVVRAGRRRRRRPPRVVRVRPRIFLVSPRDRVQDPTAPSPSQRALEETYGALGRLANSNRVLADRLASPSVDARARARPDLERARPDLDLARRDVSTRRRRDPSPAARCTT